MMAVRLRPEAKRDLKEACAYYEGKVRGLSDKLMERFNEAMVRIGKSPESPVIMQDGIRKVSLRQFPYSIIYVVDAKEIVVLALSHHSRRPGWWDDRL